MPLPKITPLYGKAVLSCLLPVISLILVAIALFAGTGIQQQQLEQYHIISINISHFGLGVLRRQNPSFATEPRKIHVGLGDIDNAVGVIQGSSENSNNQFDDLTNNGSNGVGSFPDDAIGNFGEIIHHGRSLPEWYSLHVTNYCQGVYTPNAATLGASYNTTECTALEPPGGLNLSAIFSDHLPSSERILADLLTATIQDALGYINSLLLGIFVFYVLSFGFCAFLVFLSIVTLLFDHEGKEKTHKRFIWTQMSIACLACLWLAVASVSTTLAARKGAAGISNVGKEVGVSAHEGTKLLAVSWAAFAVTFVDFLFWVGLYCYESRYRVFSPYSQLQDK
ncbi:actin cortical patch SUR7/pH-response regulator pali [Xylariaceae sp. AK1471]|nr:actin cortical patch SUR7/pH-response regulator pali [Xylariaceae sp. AK1471]